eukprot:g1805.t1
MSYSYANNPYFGAKHVAGKKLLPSSARAGPSSAATLFTCTEKFGYSVGQYCHDMLTTCWYTYLLVLLIKVHRVVPGAAGMLMFLGQLADACMGSLVEAYSEGIPSKSFYFWGSVLANASFFVMFHVDNLSSNWFAVLAITLNIGLATIAHSAFLPTLTSDHFLPPRYVPTVLANLSVFVFLAWTGSTVQLMYSDHAHARLGQELKWLAVGVVSLGAMSSSCYLLLAPSSHAQRTFSTSLHRPLLQVTPPQQDQWTVEKAKLSSRTWLAVPEFYVVGAIYIASRVATHVIPVFLPFFCLDYLYLSRHYLVLAPALFYLVGLLSSLVVGGASEKTGVKAIMWLGSLACTAACVWFSLLTGTSDNHDDDAIMLAPTALLGFGCTAMTIGSQQFQSHLIGDHDELGAFVFSCHSFLEKIATGLVIMLLESQNDGSVDFSRYAIVYVPLGATVIGLMAALSIDMDHILEGVLDSRIQSNILKENYLYAPDPYKPRLSQDRYEHLEDFGNQSIDHSYQLRPDEETYDLFYRRHDDDDDDSNGYADLGPRSYGSMQNGIIQTLAKTGIE